MAIVIQCRCGKELRAKPESAGKKSKCPHCGAEIQIPAPSPAALAGVSTGDPHVPNPTETLTYFEWGSGEAKTIGQQPSPSSSFQAPPQPSRIVHDRDPTEDTLPVEFAADIQASAATRPDGSPKQRYKVLTHKEMGFAVKFDRARLEDVLNQHAEQGYRVIAAVSMEFTSHGAPHDELVVLLERV